MFIQAKNKACRRFSRGGPYPAGSKRSGPVRRAAIWVVAALTLFSAAGCSQNPFASSETLAAQRQQAQNQQSVAQKLEIDQRVAGLDTSNKELHKQLGQSRQQVAFLSQELDKLKTQLADSRQQFAQAETARSEAEQKMQAMAVSATRRGGAIITANSSRTIDLSTLDLPGLPVRQDGDVVRIEIPADRLFPRGGVQLRPEAAGILASVAAAIRKNYPENIVGIEVHGDGDPLPPNWQSEHQLTASQAMVVFDQLTRTQRMPPNQLFVTGHGSNHPIDLSNSLVGKARNRRVDIVVYPDRYE